MTHAYLQELLTRYRDLDAIEKRAVDQHVLECAHCAARLQAYRRMDWDLARLPDPRPDERLRNAFYAAVEAGGSQTAWRTRVAEYLSGLSGLASRAIELAVFTLLVLGLGVTLHTWLRSPDAPAPTPATAMAVTATDMPEVTSRAASAHQDAIAAGGISGPGYANDRMPLTRQARAAQREIFEQVPPAAPAELAPAELAMAQDGAGGQVYIVQAGDTLWKLAEKYLGDGRRFNEIVEATYAKHAQDASFAVIEDPSRILPGSKVWIPAAGVHLAITQAAPTPATATRGPSGHIAFSFWNDHPARCTYEINIIDVAACLSNSQACQATRRIFKLNNVSEPALSPGGDRLAFRGWGEPPSEDSPYLNCAPPVKARYLANTTLDGTEFRGMGGFWEDSHPDWSPDGQQILFDTARSGDRIIRILLINADGSHERDLYIAGQQPAWAPDGQRFVYRGCDLTGNRCGLWLAYAAPVKSWEIGANRIGPLVVDERAAHPDWSPVSNQIVYQSSKNGSWDLYLVSADGATAAGSGDSGPRPLTRDPGIEGLPAWSPDGEWISYLSDAGGNWGIWIIRADGSERHLLFPFDGGIFTPKPVEPYGLRDWIDEQISWSK